jgi:hypothetical protein
MESFWVRAVAFSNSRPSRMPGPFSLHLPRATLKFRTKAKLGLDKRADVCYILLSFFTE